MTKDRILGADAAEVDKGMATSADTAASHAAPCDALQRSQDWRITRLEALASLYRLDSQMDRLGSFRQVEALAYATALDAAIEAMRHHDCDIIAALKNSGVDVECGACMEVAFTGVTTNAHTCKEAGNVAVMLSEASPTVPSAAPK